MRIALLSPYHGGSHKYWADGLINYSDHEIFPLTLPARFWKWRMHGGAITLARKFLSSSIMFDLILATDMIDLTTFLALTRERTNRTPIILYMHENQLTYPLPKDPGEGPMRRQRGERDLHYAFINFSSMLAADYVIFNSRFHRDQLLTELPSFLKGFPELNETEKLAELNRKSSVFPIGIDVQKTETNLRQDFDESTPLIVWNQRWEYDKNPKAMFEILFELVNREISFKIAICGQNFRNRPHEFDQALEKLSNRIVHFGYAKSDDYYALLSSAHVTFSTAKHEFFGIAVLEAMACETYPVLPNKLCYPEILPAQFHDACLYSNQGQLLDKLTWALLNKDLARNVASEIAEAVESYQWLALAPKFDEILEELANFR
jgi:glycosyltransferase involved in cell wall biosynthesis